MIFAVAVLTQGKQRLRLKYAFGGCFLYLYLKESAGLRLKDALGALTENITEIHERARSVVTCCHP